MGSLVGIANGKSGVDHPKGGDSS
ncbi:uncharacterized protein METZ01_LOCUS138285, partial [marine metagenome]